MTNLNTNQKIDCLKVLKSFRERKTDIFRAMFEIESIIARPQKVEIKSVQVPTIDYCATVQWNELAAHNEALERFDDRQP